MQPPLERHVVVGDALVEGRIFGWRGRRGLAGSGGRPGGAARHGHGLLAVFVGGGAAALLTAAQKHEVLADDFGGVDLLAILIVVASGFRSAWTRAAGCIRRGRRRRPPDGCPEARGARRRLRWCRPSCHPYRRSFWFPAGLPRSLAAL